MMRHWLAGFLRALLCLRCLRWLLRCLLWPLQWLLALSLWVALRCLQWALAGLLCRSNVRLVVVYT